MAKVGLELVQIVDAALVELVVDLIHYQVLRCGVDVMAAMEVRMEMKVEVVPHPNSSMILNQGKPGIISFVSSEVLDIQKFASVAVLQRP